MSDPDHRGGRPEPLDEGREVGVLRHDHGTGSPSCLEDLAAFRILQVHVPHRTRFDPELLCEPAREVWG
jgi:hypothetical protein